jgi:hypothetical protein
MNSDHTSLPEPANDNDMGPMLPPVRPEAFADPATDLPPGGEAASFIQKDVPPLGDAKLPPSARMGVSTTTRPTLVPEGSRDAGNHAKLLALMDQIHDMAAESFVLAKRETEPGPRAKLVKDGASLTATYAKLLEKELVLRTRLLGTR